MEYSDFPPGAWSLQRRYLLSFCPRAALLRYREARSGSNPEADARLQMLVRLKGKISREAFLRHLLTRAMRELYYRPGGGDAEEKAADLDLTLSAITAFEREFHTMLTRGCNSRGEVLAELLEPECRPTEMKRQLLTELTRRSEMYDSGAFAEILRTPAEQRRFIPSPLGLQINDQSVYTAPLLARDNGDGTLWIVEHLRAVDSDSENFLVLTHKFYALNALGRDPMRVRSFLLEAQSGEFRELGADFDVSDTLRQLDGEAAKWQELLALPLPEIAVEADVCKKCYFSPFCADEG